MVKKKQYPLAHKIKKPFAYTPADSTDIRERRMKERRVNAAQPATKAEQDGQDKRATEIFSFGEMAENWDSYGAKPFPKATISLALMVSRLLDAEWRVIPVATGSIEFSRNNEDECIEVRTSELWIMCGRCYDKVEETFSANCGEKPETLLGKPIGQYHCPDCGAMVLAGVPHPELCKPCIDRKHPKFDREEERRW